MAWNQITTEAELVTYESRALSAGNYSAEAIWSNSAIINQVVMLALAGAGRVVQSVTNAHVDAGGFTTWTIALPADVTAGNAMILDLKFKAAVAVAGPVTVADDLGNVWTQEIVSHPAFQSSFMSTFTSFGILAGANTVTITMGGTHPFTAIAAALQEHTGLTATTASTYGCGGLFGTGSPVDVTVASLGGGTLHLAVSPQTLLTSVTGGGFLPCTAGWLMINEPGTPNIWTDQSHYLHTTESITFSWIARQRGTAKVPLIIAGDDDYMPTIGSQVCLWDITEEADFEVFSGTIDDYEVKWLGINGDRIVTLTCVSLDQVFDTIRLPALRFVDQTAGDIFTALYAYASGSPVTLGTVDTGVTIAEFLVADFPSIAEMFTRLATESQYVWGIDPGSGELYFHAPETTPSPFTLDSEDVLWEQMTLKEERHDYRNRQILKPNTNAAILSKELFSGSGQSSFTLLRPCQQITNAWLTQNRQNFATGTFTGQPSVGDVISFKTPQSGSTYNWSAGGTYAVGAIIIDSNGFIQKVTTSVGVTGATEPAWVEVYGQITQDNLVQWQNQGPSGFQNGDLADYTFVDSLDGYYGAAGLWPITAANPTGKMPANAQFGLVLIGANLAATIQNLVDAINAIQTLAGVTFSLATWENPVVNADTPAGATTIIVRNKAAEASYITALDKVCANFSWSSPLTTGGVTTFGTVVITFGVDGQTTGGSVFTIVYTPGSNIIRSATPLQPGNRLQIEYLATNAGFVQVEDTAQVIERAAIEGGTGLYQQSSSDDTAVSLPVALQLAQQQLAAFVVIPKTFEFTTMRAGLYVGQVLDILLSNPSDAPGLINASWFIQEIQAEVVPVYGEDGASDRWLPDGGHFRYTVTCIDVAQIGSWLDFWLGLSTGGGGGSSSAVFPSGGALGTSSSSGSLSGSAVLNIADLYAITAPTSMVSCVVEGYYTADDGGGGVFVWDATSTTTDNAGTVILPTGYTGVGRWRRLYEGAVYVRWFGAKGDGTTNDTPAIQAAITEAAAHWLRVAFDGSTYLCTDLTLSTNGMILTGQAGTVLKNRTASHALLTISANYCAVDLIKFNGNSGIGGTTANVLITGAHNHIFRCKSFGSTDQGFGFDGQATTCNFNSIESCESYSNAGIGISTNTAPDNRFLNCWVYNNGLEGITLDVLSHRCQVIGCRIDANCQTGGVGNIGIDGVNDCTISACIVTSAVSKSGVKTQNNTGDTNRLVITGCSFQGNGLYGVDLFGGSGGAANNCTVTGNDFQGNTSGTIRVSAAACTNNMIAGNALNGTAVADSGTGTVIIQTAPGGSGTVTSVALTVPGEFSVAGSPVTTTGTLAVTKANQTANLIYAGPVSGAAAQPTFRAIVSADLPAITASTHSESLTDGDSNFIFAGGDIVTVVGVAN